MPKASVSRPVRLLLTAGDPSGIGPEVLLKALALRLGRSSKIPDRPELVEGRRTNGLLRANGYDPSLTVIGDLELLRRTARSLKLEFRWDRFGWIDSGRARVVPGRTQPAAGRAAYRCLQEAVRLIRAGAYDALVTAPVSKEAIVRAGISWIGHTEYLAQQFRCKTTMMFVTGNFRVSLLTSHCAIRDLPRRLSRRETIRVLNDTYDFIRRDLGILRPRLALASLNPHAGENGMFGDEEKKILVPAVRAFKKAQGPLPVDTLMKQAAGGAYDAVVAIYHDQALIPVKLLGWDKSVNVTLGLPFIRTSPVHGTAFDIAGKGKADPRSMQAAIVLAIELAGNRK